MTFEEGDAEALPYRDGSFDVVATLVGAMFAPRQNLVAAELTRVCRPGGVIAMANWAPEMTRRTYRFDYPFTPAGVVDFFRANYGPMTWAFATLDEGGQQRLHEELTELWAGHNRARGERTQVEAEYLEAMARRG